MRTILFVLALLGATVGRGQIFLDWYSQAPAATLLLDDYPNAAVAFSLRALNSAYTGNCIQVRRSNDNALQDVGFAGGIVDTAALKTFCGANNCFVSTWYDQSGNTRDVTQITNADQPQIISSGNLIYSDGLPAVQISTTDHFNLPTFPTLTNSSAFIVSAQIGTANARWFDIITSTQSLQLSRDAQSQLITMKNTAWQSALTSTTFNQMSISTQHLISAFFLSASNTMFIGSNSVATTTSVAVGAAGTVGKIGLRADANAVTQFLGFFQEIIIYPSDQTSNRTGIEANIDNFYNVY